MTVSVIILNWNTKSLLEQFLPVVIKNSVHPGVEIMIADNGSTDDSVNWLRDNYPQIKILELKENFGYAGGYNKAISQIGSELVVLLNSDAAPGENWLPPLIETMQENPQTIACVPGIKDFRNPDFFEYAGASGGFIDRFGYAFCRGRIFNVPEKDDGQYNKPGQIFWGSGSALMVNRNLFIKTGGFDHDFFAHMEEIDWCWRVKNRGYDIRYVPSSVIFHLGGGTLSYKNPRKNFLNFRNNLLLILKNKPGIKGWVTLLFRFFLDYLAMLKFIFSNEFDFAIQIPKAHYKFLSRFGYYLKKRRALMPLVTKPMHPEIYRGSIVWDFFIRNKKHFSQLSFDPE